LRDKPKDTRREYTKTRLIQQASLKARKFRAMTPVKRTLRLRHTDYVVGMPTSTNRWQPPEGPLLLGSRGEAKKNDDLQLVSHKFVVASLRVYISNVLSYFPLPNPPRFRT